MLYSTLNPPTTIEEIHVTLTWLAPRAAWEIYGWALARGWSAVPRSPFRAATGRCDKNVPSNGTMCYDDAPVARLLIDWGASRIARRFSYLRDEKSIQTFDQRYNIAIMSW